MRRKRIECRLPFEDEAALQRLADDTRLSSSALIVLAVRRLLTDPTPLIPRNDQHNSTNA